MSLSYYFARKFAALHPANFMVLSYDELLGAPEDTMRRVAAFLEIESTPSLLQTTFQGRPPKGSGWAIGSCAENRMTTSGKDAWKTQLSPLAVRLVNFCFPHVLEAFGYPREPARVRPWRRFDRSERLRTYVANRWLFTRAARKAIRI